MEKELIGVLYNIRSVHNVGSIFRTADAAGVSKLYLCGITPGPLDRFGAVRRDFTKVSLGAEATVAWERVVRTAPLLRRLKRDGWFLCAVEQGKTAVPLHAFKTRKQRITLVLGNEVRGIPRPISKQCDAMLEIPMFGKKESLNVVVAFGIAAYRVRLGV